MVAKKSPTKKPATKKPTREEEIKNCVKTILTQFCDGFDACFVKGGLRQYDCYEIQKIWPSKKGTPDLAIGVEMKASEVEQEIADFLKFVFRPEETFAGLEGVLDEPVAKLVSKDPSASALKRSRPV